MTFSSSPIHIWNSINLASLGKSFHIDSPQFGSPVIVETVLGCLVLIANFNSEDSFENTFDFLSLKRIGFFEVYLFSWLNNLSYSPHTFDISNGLCIGISFYFRDSKSNIDCSFSRGMILELNCDWIAIDTLNKYAFTISTVVLKM